MRNRLHRVNVPEETSSQKNFITGSAPMTWQDLECRNAGSSLTSVDVMRVGDGSEIEGMHGKPLAAMISIHWSKITLRRRAQRDTYPKINSTMVVALQGTSQRVLLYLTAPGMLE